MLRGIHTHNLFRVLAPPPLPGRVAAAVVLLEPVVEVEESGRVDAVAKKPAEAEPRATGRGDGGVAGRSAMIRSLKGSYGIDLKLLFSSDKGISNDPYVKALFDRKKPGWVGYPGIFFDQQLAACATIAFVKNEGSTFSNFINELRKDNLSETCNHGMDIP